MRTYDEGYNDAIERVLIFIDIREQSYRATDQDNKAMACSFLYSDVSNFKKEPKC